MNDIYQFLMMIVLVLIGMVIGIFLRSGNDGSLKIDTSDPVKDKYLLELEIPLDDISKRQTITLKVENVDLNHS